MPGAQAIAHYKVAQAYQDASSDKANMEKEHFLLTYSFNGKDGSRIMRSAGTDAFGHERYYDYGLKRELTLEQIGKVMGITDMKIGSMGKLSDAAPAGQIKVGDMRSPENAPSRKTAAEMVQESSPVVFDYYRMLNRVTKNNVNYCADFAVNVFALVALENGRVGCIASCNAWEMDGLLGQPRFSKTSLSGLDQDALRQSLVSAPAGTIITLRSHSALANSLEEGLPSHAMVSLGNGVYAQNINNRVLLVDMNRAQIIADPEAGTASIAGFDVVEKSGMYAPDFNAFPKASEVTVKASDLGLADRATPSKFAEAVSEKFGIPKTFVIGQILMQAGIKASELGYTRSGLQITLSLPSYMVAEYVPQFRITPALAKLRPQQPEIQVQEAGFFTFGGSADKTNRGGPIDSRRDDFNGQIEKLRGSATALGISRGEFNNLMAILYNETYSSKKGIEVRKAEKSVYAGIFGVDALRKINTTGDFQINIDAVCAMLSKKEGMADFRAAMGKLGISDKELDAKLVAWGGLDQKKKRKLVTEKVLANGMMSLYFAYEFYKSSASVLQENAFKHFGLDLPVGGTEVSAFFAHNRGVPRTMAAIFQQNLIIVAEEAGIDISGIKIDGIIGDGTVELYKKVCKHFGVKEAPQDLFKGYSSMAKFFKAGLKSSSAKALLDPEFLRAHSANLSPYLANYFVFFNDKDARVSASKKLPKEYELGLSVTGNMGHAPSISYTVPETGIARIRIIGINGKTVLSMPQKNAEPGEHILPLDAKKLPSGVYFCEIAQGGKTKVQKFIVTKGF
ncbi:MAG: T9SS type A sorting domain-containing protein [Candidatus Micrarchaeota archaeon]|nr:T9SS type A sorting domain-containing protein [Candidatus Micrarchaeota archaeon]